MTRSRTAGAAAAIAASLGLLLSGCSGATTPSGPTSASTAPVRPTTTVTATATPTTASVVTPTPTSRPSSTSTSTSTSSSKRGCSNGRTTIPSGSTTASIHDVDRDGKPDTEFMTETPPFQYGVRTSAGGVYTIDDLPGGPGRVSGWTSSTFDGPHFPLTVVDDGREGDLYTFVGCRFIRPVMRKGVPFVFPLNGSEVQGPGTGVACTDENGGQLLARADAVKRSNGRYDVLWTVVQFTADGKHADYETPADSRYAGLHAEDPPVLDAMRSRCLDTPIVHTSGQ